MSIPLDPPIDELSTQQQADSYDTWFRERIQRSLDDPRPSIPHSEAMARIRAAIAKQKLSTNAVGNPVDNHTK